MIKEILLYHGRRFEFYRNDIYDKSLSGGKNNNNPWFVEIVSSFGSCSGVEELAFDDSKVTFEIRNPTENDPGFVVRDNWTFWFMFLG